MGALNASHDAHMLAIDNKVNLYGLINKTVFCYMYSWLQNWSSFPAISYTS